MNIRYFIGYVDIFIVLLFFIMLYMGWTKGIFNAITFIVSKFFGGIILSFLLAIPLSNFLGSLFLNDLINSERIGQFFSENLPLGDFVSGILTTIVDFIGVIFISFLIILIGSKILMFIVKKIVAVLREWSLFRNVDGFLGVIGMFFTFLAVLFLLFTALQFLINFNHFPTFTNFVIKDMQLDSDRFSISSFLFNNSLLDVIISIIPGGSQ